VTEGGRWPGDETAPTEILPGAAAERRILAALAIVGRASLSADELAELSETDEVRPVIDDLERRGLIKRDEQKRYSATARVGQEIRKTDEALATGDRLLQYMTTLAKGGKLTPERLLEDAEAILGLSEWAGETGQWAALLELVKTVEACFSIAHRVDEWLALLERGRSAARALGDLDRRSGSCGKWRRPRRASAIPPLPSATCARPTSCSAVPHQPRGASHPRSRPWPRALVPRAGPRGSSAC
jgi:hypothetical protein